MRHINILSLCTLIFLGLAGCSSSETARRQENPAAAPQLMGDEAVQQLFPSPDYGVHAFMWWRPDTIARDLELVNELGFNWVKQKFPWREIEGIEKGQYDWYRPDRIVDEAEEAGINLLVRLDTQPFWSEPQDNLWHENQPPDDYQDFADFCGAVAGRYPGRIGAYQVWNEPNLGREWGKDRPILWNIQIS